MKTKKILAVVLSVIMLLSSAPLGGLIEFDLPSLFKIEASAASYDGIIDGLYYKISNGEVTITDYDESSETVVIPSTIDGYPVTSIGDGAFEWCYNLTSVTIPDSVTSIGDFAFEWCMSLTSVTIPDSVTSIGASAFEACTSLTSVTIPDSVTSIGASAFYCCYSFTSISVSDENKNYSSDSYGVLYNKDKTTLIQYPLGNSCTLFTIPDSVTSIGDYAFYDCKSLTSIEIPDSVTSIGDDAFAYCRNLTSVTIPDSVTSIGASAFYCCYSFTSISVSDENKNYSSDSYGVLYNKDKTTLIQYPLGNSCTSFTIPDSVTSIGDSAFSFCNSLTSVTIGNSVTSIGGYAFSHCTSLTSIEIPNSVTSIGKYAFEWCTSLTSIEIPDSVTSIGTCAFDYCRSLASVTIGNSVTSIGDWAFYDCTSLTSIEIPDSVTSIGRYAFYGTAYYDNRSNWDDSALYISDYLIGVHRSISGSYKIRNGTKIIAGCVFSYCDGLTSVEIPDSVTSIGDFAFEWCKSLTSVEIPDSVTSIGDRAFDGCESLTSIAVTVTNENYSSDSNGVLYNKDKTILIQYPTGNRRTSFIIPDSVTSIGYRAFAWCENLTSVAIPDSVTSIGDDAFAYCRNLTSVTIPDSVLSISTGTFKGCTNLTSVTIGNSVTTIGEFAFYDCTSLTSIEIPDSVESIGNRAFGYYYNGGLKKIDNFTIYGYKCTTAEKYANENGFKFVDLNHTHTFGEWTVTKPATCKETGVKERTCTECSEKETAIINKLTTHTYKTTTTKATLTANGKTETKCSVCGDVSKTTVIYSPKTFTLSATKFTYTGKEIKPTVAVKDSKGKVIASSNYTVSYSNNTNARTAKVTIKFKGNYSGTKTVNFTITPKQVTGLKASTVEKDSIKLTWSKTGGAKYYKVEQSTDGKKWKTVTTTDKTSYTVKKLTAGKKYQFRVTALDSTKKIAGKTSSVLKTGTLTKAPTLTLKSSKSKTATASWKKVTGAKKYVVYKSTNGKKWKKVTTTTKTSYTLKKLTGGKKIYVRVAALNAYGEASAYSSSKNVKVKK